MDSPVTSRKHNDARAYWRAPSGDGGLGDTPGVGRCELDRVEFERVYAVHSRAVFSTVQFQVGEEFAEEATQETFLRFWQHPERFDPERARLRTYLLMIARHVGIDMIRSQQARRYREDRVHHTQGTFACDVDHELLRGERIQCLLGAIEKLTASQRDVILTICYGEISYQAAALILDIPEGTVKSRIRVAFGQLRRAMSEPDDPLAANLDSA